MLDAKNDSRPLVTIRKVLKIGPSSLYFNLPRDFVRRFNIQKGTRLAIVGDSILKVLPIE